MTPTAWNWSVTKDKARLWFTLFSYFPPVLLSTVQLSFHQCSCKREIMFSLYDITLLCFSDISPSMNKRDIFARRNSALGAPIQTACVFCSVRKLPLFQKKNKAKAINVTESLSSYNLQIITQCRTHVVSLFPTNEKYWLENITNLARQLLK